jgi:hypothetical protein
LTEQQYNDIFLSRADIVLVTDGITTTLQNDNDFMYRDPNPPAQPDKLVRYSLTITGHENDYVFFVRRPSDEDFYADFRQSVIQGMTDIARELWNIPETDLAMSGNLGEDSETFKGKRERIRNIYRKYTAYAYPHAYNLEAYKELIVKDAECRRLGREITDTFTVLHNLLVKNLVVGTSSSYNTEDDRIDGTKHYLDTTLHNFSDYDAWLAVKDDPEVKAAISLVQTRHKRYTGRKKSRDFLSSIFDNYRKFGSLGLSAGTSLAAPWLIASVNGTWPLFPYTFLEAGFDLGLIHGYEERDDIGYYSFYPYAHFNFLLPFREYGGLFIGAGGGYMMAFYNEDRETTEFMVPAFDGTTGIHIGHKHYFTLAYTIRTSFENLFAAINHKVSFGYTFRFGNP